MQISVYELCGKKSILSGTFSGRQLLSALIAAVPSKDSPEVIFLDFTSVDVATSSFLRESIFSFRSFTRRSIPSLYPVISNASNAVLDELDFYLKQTNDSIWYCTLEANGSIGSATILGELEPSLRETFDLVQGLGRTSAPQLAALPSERTIGVTAWNNRLSALSGKGLIVERRDGKTKTFSPVLESV